MCKKYIFVCEAGWRIIREFSIMLAEKKTANTVLIKGFPDKKVRHMITRHKEINNIFIPIKIFSLFLYGYIFLNIGFNRKVFVFVTKDKTYNRMVKLNRIFPALVVEKV